MAESKGPPPNRLIEMIRQLALESEIGESFKAAGRGIEKESLRITPAGSISQLRHPKGLGSPLTHPNITTDFSEAQLELITGVHKTARDAIDELDTIHRFVFKNLGSEIIWTSSMPCDIASEREIPIGHYGSSNIALTKNIYRRGLSHRYGRYMQAISGIHYNFSLPEAFWKSYFDFHQIDDTQSARDEVYFSLIRNFRRFSWLLIYLFGASPATCKTFKNNTEELKSFDQSTLFYPFATSLRMGKVGYQSDAQSELHISYNSLEDYDQSMRKALTVEYPPYQDIGIQKDGEYRQLNVAILQIENEFYGTIRPKRNADSRERPLNALNRRGVEYVEVRCLDLNPFVPTGIDEETINFLDIFLYYCALADSPLDNRLESMRIQENQLKVVETGRETSGILNNGESLVTIKEWGGQLLDAMKPIISILDGQNDQSYLKAWQDQKDKLEDPGLTPSGLILNQMIEANQSFFEFALNQSELTSIQFKNNKLESQQLSHQDHLAYDSVQRQKEIEGLTAEPFEVFLKDFLSL